MSRPIASTTPPTDLVLPLSGRRFSARQTDVLDALEGVFFEAGLEVTVAQLARRAGCSRRLLYELAPSKEELFLLVLDRMMRRVGAAARRAVAAEASPEDRMAALLHAAAVAFQPVSPAFLEAIAAHRPAGWLFDVHLSLIREFVVETIEQGTAGGDFNQVHPRLAAEVLLAAARRATDPRLLSTTGMSAADALEELRRLMVNGLAR